MRVEIESRQNRDSRVWYRRKSSEWDLEEGEEEEKEEEEEVWERLGSLTPDQDPRWQDELNRSSSLRGVDGINLCDTAAK